RVLAAGVHRRLPRARSQVNGNKVPDTAVLVQTIVAGAFALLAFVVLPTIGFGGGSPVEVQTKIYDVLQAAVTVIWCVSMVILFIDVLIIIRRFSGAFEATKLANPPIFYLSSLLGGLAAFIGIVATLSGAWTPL